MYKSFLFISIYLFITSFSYSQEHASSWELNQQEHFSVKHPHNWEIDTSGHMGTEFIILSPLSSESDRFRENVNFLVQDLNGFEIDLDQYVALTKEQIATMATDGKILTSERFSKEHQEIHRLIYTAKQGSANLKFEQYFWLQNDGVYVFTLTTDKSEFENYKQIGEQIFNSLFIK